MASTDMDNLLSMGFSQVKAEYALKKTGNGTMYPNFRYCLLDTDIPTVEGAVDWLEKNENKSDDEITALAAEAAAADDDDETNPNIEPAALTPGEVAQSLVCNECEYDFRKYVMDLSLDWDNSSLL